MAQERGALPAEKQAALHMARGVELQAKGDLHGAVEAYRAALEVDPTAYEAHNNLGSVFAGLGDRKTALVFFQAAVRANPQATEVWRNLANALAGEDSWNRPSKRTGQRCAWSRCMPRATATWATR